MSIERSPSKCQPKNFYQHLQLQDTFKMDDIFPQGVSGYPVFKNEATSETKEIYSSDSFDCIDGKVKDSSYKSPNEGTRFVGENCSFSGEIKEFKAEGSRNLRLRESETRFNSSSESERRFEIPYDFSQDDKQRSKNPVKIKIAKQKQLDEDDELDSDTRIYGKSPKFDDNFGSLRTASEQMNERRSLNIRGIEMEGGIYPGDEDSSRLRDGVVFNTLEGFGNDDIENMNLDPNGSFYLLENTEEQISIERVPVQDYLRHSEERKLSVGQIKRPLSQDEDVSSKTGRVLESPEVTPSEIGRMLNLGNVFDGPRQSQANKYLRMVTLHLPVILRLSVNCPFQNVRIKCAEILAMVKVIIHFSSLNYVKFNLNYTNLFLEALYYRSNTRNEIYLILS